MLRGRGEPLVAIPVFPSFSFRHSSIFVGTHAGITGPKDLVGKRVGVPKYHMTAAVWIRGMLEDEYGVAPRDILWFEGGEGSLVKEVDVTLPPDVRHQLVPAGRNLGDMVAAGELDAYVGACRPAAFGARVTRLFPRLPSRRARLLREDRDLPDHARPRPAEKSWRANIRGCREASTTRSSRPSAWPTSA